MKLYLRCAGRQTPLPWKGSDVRTRVWTVRIDRAIVGYVTAARHSTGQRESAPAFRGFTASGSPVTSHLPNRTATRNLTAARKGWA